MKQIVILFFTLAPIFAIAQWTPSGTNIYNTNTGNVGIGITAPDRKFYVRGVYSTTNALSAFELQNSAGTQSVAASFYAYPASTTSNTYLQNTFMMYLGGTTGLHMNFANPKVNGTIRFHTGGFDSEATQRMIIAYNGNIGIGVSNPAELLHLNGSIRGNQSGALRINSGTGYVDVGSMNSSWVHFQTDRPGYYFNKSLTVDSGLIGSYDEDLSLQTAGVSRFNISNSTGNIGINTTPHGTYRLDVNGPINATALYVNGAPFSGGGGGVQSILEITPGNGNGIRFWSSDAFKIHMGGAPEYLYGPVFDFSIKSNMSNEAGRGWTWGIVGSTPVAALNNTGQMKIAGAFEAVGPVTGSGPTIRASGGGDVVLNSGGSVFFEGNYSHGSGNYIRPIAANTQAFFTAGAERMRIASNGNVGIGTALATNPNNYKLAVNGLIGAKEVKVENTSTTWPDYVFASDYKLKPLDELELYIQVNKHLPEIPSATEIAEKGHALGEMNSLLLKKVEELTLYIIDLKKEVDALKNEKK